MRPKKFEIMQSVTNDVDWVLRT